MLFRSFSGDLFKGMLAFFLLDMGLMAARNMAQLKGKSPVLMAYAVLGPVCHAALALALSWWLGLSAGDGALLMVLAASASYIAAPPAVRMNIPDANPTYSLTLALLVTFPFNLLVGIPLYHQLSELIAR